MSELWLGTRGDDRVELPAAALLRHVMALGASGSGKTVLCKVLTEAACLAGIPAICIDPQGDLASLAAGGLDAKELEARGVPRALAEELLDRIEVVVFTPGSRRGIPLCADPVDPKLAEMGEPERVAAVTRTAAVTVGLLGFDLDSDDGAGLSAVMDRALHDLIARGGRPSLAALTEHLLATDAEDGFEAFSRYLDAKKIRTACQRLARLDVGARRALFHDGVPVDIDVLLGRDPRAPVAEGKTRVAVIYLNTLHQQEDKDFFVATLVDRLYGWMLRHPRSEPQALFYIDEVAPFVPPVRKPACKEGLSLLFKQARKYGVCCLMATQNPGDVDYRAMAQFGTWALGRLTTRQDLKKVEPTIKSLAPDEADHIAGQLPALKPGELVMLSPDHFDEPIELTSRWLITRHETWGEAEVEAYTDPMRQRWATLAGAPSEALVPEPGAAAQKQETAEKKEPARQPETPPKAGAGAAAPERSEPAPEAPTETRQKPGPEITAHAAASSSQEKLRAALLSALEGGPASTKELVKAAKRSESAVRRGLSRLVEEGLVDSFRQGRSQQFWLKSTGGRPDLHMPERMAVLVSQIDRTAAEEIGRGLARTKLLGLIGDDERFERAEPLHRLVYKLDFEERVERPLLQRVFGAAYDDRVGSVYVHAHNLGVVVFTEEEGIRFDDLPSSPASEVRDFDGVTRIELRAPGTLCFEDADWTDRQPVKVVRERFEQRFDAAPGDIDPLFVPLWVLYFQNETGSLRRVQIDGLVGKPVRWLPPR